MKPKTYCEKWPAGCQFCDLLLCDGKKKQPTTKMDAPSELDIEANNLLRKMVGAKPYKPQTNADRIRSMTDEELADWVWGAETAGRAYGPRGKKAWLDWLKQEASK